MCPRGNLPKRWQLNPRQDPKWIRIPLSRKLVAQSDPNFQYYVEGMTLFRKQVSRKTKFLDFFAKNKKQFSPVSKICFWPHPQTANLSTLRPGSFVAPVKMYTTVKKVSENYCDFRENRGKRFFFGGNFPLNVGKLSKRKVVSYMGARSSTTRPWLDNVNFPKNPNVSRFCVLFKTSLILGRVRRTKSRTVCVVFQSEYDVKISSTGKEV